MIEIHMPRLSDTMTEGAISEWRKKPGDQVEVGDILVDIETDKAIMEYEAYQAGILSRIVVEDGQPADIGAVIALLDDGSPATETPSAPVREQLEARPTENRQPASPLVRKIARQHDLDLATVAGTGPGGRIIRKDIMAAIESQQAPVVETNARDASPLPSAPLDQARQSEEVPLSNIRRVIARRLSDSAQTVPHYYVTADADAEGLVLLRGELNKNLQSADKPKISVNDLLVRACALALREHPALNASYVDDESDHLLMHRRANIGIAMAAPSGLVVPVIVDADHKTVSQIGAESREFGQLAHDRKLTPAQMNGATFTISNLGMFGVEQFTAIINSPEAGILAVGSLRPEPTVIDGDIVVRHRLRYTLSADHRIIDGAEAAQFLSTLTRLIENPWSIVA